MNVAHDAFAKKQQIAMPAVALWQALRERNRNEAVLALQPRQVKQARPFAKAPVGFLYGYDIRADFADHMRDAIRVELLVHAHAFVHIVGSDDGIRTMSATSPGSGLSPVPDCLDNLGCNTLLLLPHRREYFPSILS